MDPNQDNGEIEYCDCDCEICINKDKHEELEQFTKPRELYLILYSILKLKSRIIYDNEDDIIKSKYVDQSDYNTFIENHPMLRHKSKFKKAHLTLKSQKYFLKGNIQDLDKSYSIPGDLNTINPWLPIDQQLQSSSSIVSQNLHFTPEIKNENNNSDNSLIITFNESDEEYGEEYDEEELNILCDCEICINKQRHIELEQFSQSQELFLIIYSILKQKSKEHYNSITDFIKSKYVNSNDYYSFIKIHPFLKHKLKFKKAHQILKSQIFFLDGKIHNLNKQYGLPGSSDLNTINPWLPIGKQLKPSRSIQKQQQLKFHYEFNNKEVEELEEQNNKKRKIEHTNDSDQPNNKKINNSI